MSVALVLNALVSLPKIASYIESWASQITLWWVLRQKSQTLAAISDAAALGARAQTDEDRYKATDAWHAVFGNSRVSQ